MLPHFSRGDQPLLDGEALYLRWEHAAGRRRQAMIRRNSAIEGAARLSSSGRGTGPAIILLSPQNLGLAQQQ
jgi:hypothetical protein